MSAVGIGSFLEGAVGGIRTRMSLDAEKRRQEADDRLLTQAEKPASAAPTPPTGAPSDDFIKGVDDRYTAEEARREVALWSNTSPEAIAGLSDKFVIRKAAFLEDNPHEAMIGITSGHRSEEKQRALYEAAVKKYGSEAAARKWVAPPGKSEHNHGNAADLSFDDDASKKWAHENAARYGLGFRMKHEPWHVSLLEGHGSAGHSHGSTAGSGKAFATGDPASVGMPGYRRAFLNAVSGGESGGRYDIRYDGGAGATITDFSKHPGVMVPGPHGATSAAGRYQFVKSTWDSLGGGDFSPENQDARAWQLAEQRYKAATGKSLDADLQKGGLTPDILKALSPTWKAFEKNTDRHIATYQSSLDRYGKQPAARSVIPKEPVSPGSAALSFVQSLFPVARGILGGGK